MNNEIIDRIDRLIMVLEECLDNGNRGSDLLICWFWKDKSIIEELIQEIKRLIKELNHDR